MGDVEGMLEVLLKGCWRYMDEDDDDTAQREGRE
jgi:hypothetical protein